MRTDSPLFSSVHLADGPLTLYDLEEAAGCPDTITTSACAGAGAVVLPGDEPLGFATALLTRGARQVLGSVTSVPDAEAATFMAGLHRRLARGEPVADALAACQAQTDPDDVRGWAAAAGFVCLGAGFAPVPPVPPVHPVPAVPGGVSGSRPQRLEGAVSES